MGNAKVTLLERKQSFLYTKSAWAERRRGKVHPHLVRGWCSWRDGNDVISGSDLIGRVGVRLKSHSSSFQDSDQLSHTTQRWVKGVARHQFHYLLFYYLWLISKQIFNHPQRLSSLIRLGGETQLWLGIQNRSFLLHLHIKSLGERTRENLSVRRMESRELILTYDPIAGRDVRAGREWRTCLLWWPHGGRKDMCLPYLDTDRGTMPHWASNPINYTIPWNGESGVGKIQRIQFPAYREWRSLFFENYDEEEQSLILLVFKESQAPRIPGVV